MAVIDRETCMHFRKGKELDACRACEDVCEAKAIDYDQQEELVDLDVGAVVVAPGFELCDHTLRAEYGFGQYPNVMSSLQFERVLSASGPYQGHVQRPSDGKEPKRIASIQCVGSREDDARFCSSVCCMYAVKHALMAKEHMPGTEYTVFFMDLRAYGKGFDAYYQRAQQEGSPVRAGAAGHGRGGRRGPQPPHQVPERARRVQGRGVRPGGPLVRHAAGDAGRRAGLGGWAWSVRRTATASRKPLAPLETNRPGVFVCGTFSEPKDIPETVMQASGAAAGAMGLLAEARGTLVEPKQYPPERRRCRRGAADRRLRLPLRPQYRRRRQRAAGRGVRPHACPTSSTPRTTSTRAPRTAR